MISVPTLKRIATFATNRFYISGFQIINRKYNQSTVVHDVLVDEDMPIELEKNPYEREKRLCILCKLNIEPDYKNVRLLSQFQSRYTGRIYGKHITGLCEHKQKRIEEEILKAQNAGLMGYMTKEPTYVKDPKLFDPNHPFKPHNY